VPVLAAADRNGPGGELEQLVGDEEVDRVSAGGLG
jgi:hypothetical protein